MWPSREHQRIVMEPVGKPLRFLESVPELIIVLRDTMRCHGAILSECSILYCNISINNILVVQTESGHTEMTGTPPFMSVLNLENSPVKRTAPDDWESLIYVICWLGTYDINEHTRRKEADGELKKLKTRRWHYGSFDEIALEKRNHLSLHEAFGNNNLTGFNPNMEHRTMLARLASELRATLIEWEGEPDCKGSLKRPKQSGPLAGPRFYGGGNKDRIDPFEQRAKHCKRISAELLGVLEKYAREAEELMATQQQQQQQQQAWQRRGRDAQ
ncbi:hypothetical protein EV182_000286 [Spiromyces aspiralis]|uniref:Uncharacterized protein n=1 Tax=Spiromyces aspiralis TaxID=68401 RepID=A0ACC1HUL8_9FUNG|nr:hypothetical protein EV182_000286 [Spiromyces aspiralis]